MNLFALLDQTAARHGDRGAVYLGDEQLHTWAELRDRALRLAASIRRAAPGGHADRGRQREPARRSWN